MTYTAWSADGRGVERLEYVHPNAIVDIPSDDEIGGHSLPPRGVERFNEGHPPSSSAPTPSPSLGQTRGREDMDARPHPFSGIK